MSQGCVSRETDRSASAPVRPSHPFLPWSGRGAGCRRGGAGHRPSDAYRRGGGRSLPARIVRRRTPHPLVAVGGRRDRACRSCLAHRTRRAPGECRGQVGVEGAAAGAGRIPRARMAQRAADRLTGRPSDTGSRRARRLFRPLPPAVGAGGGGPGGCTGADRHRGLGVGGDHRRHLAADPLVHGADRLGHPQSDGPPMADAVPAVRTLPGRRRGTAHAQGVRPGQGAGRGDPEDHRRVPAGDHADAPDRLPVVLRPGTARHHLGRAGRGDHRNAARPRRDGPVRGARDPRPGTRGLSAAAAGGSPVPRRRRGTRGRRRDLRGAGDPGAEARFAASARRGDRLRRGDRAAPGVLRGRGLGRLPDGRTR